MRGYKGGRTSVNNGVGAFTDFLVFCPAVRPRRSRRHRRASRQGLPFPLTFCVGLFDGIHLIRVSAAVFQIWSDSVSSVRLRLSLKLPTCLTKFRLH